MGKAHGKLLRRHIRGTCGGIMPRAGSDKLLTFLTNNFESTFGSVCDFYRSHGDHRDLIQGNQAAPADQDLHWIQQARHRVATLVRHALIPPTAPQGMADRLEERLQALLHARQGRGVEPARPRRSHIACYGTAKRLQRADLCPTMPYLPGFEGLQFR